MRSTKLAALLPGLVTDLHCFAVWSFVARARPSRKR
jgi:hypothetical protein